jgi:predicted metal-dependent hydrolase
VSISSLRINSNLDPTLVVSGIAVQIVRKSIKNLHLSVCPPNGYVRVAVPLHMTDDNVRLAVISRLRWIKKQQASFQAQPRQSEREMVTGESHYVFGKRFRLEVIERRGCHEIVIKNNSTLQLFVNPGTSTQNRVLVLNEWYRAQLKAQIPELLDHWQEAIAFGESTAMSKQIVDWGIKKMKTKWGSCNITQRRIWLNLELAKKPIECLEYVLVHELVHLLERHHGDRFKAYMDKYLPQWQRCRDILKREPLGNENWMS